jgi:cytochrome P450/NADPH-cytochrome P450 reductase
MCTLGHETTSGVLSFVVHSLITNSGAYAKLKAEVDTVVGERAVTLEDIPKLTYMTGMFLRRVRLRYAYLARLGTAAVIREAMRLYPPASARAVVPIEDTTIGNGKYAMKKGSILVVQTICAQRDTRVYGEDVSNVPGCLT